MRVEWETKTVMMGYRIPRLDENYHHQHNLLAYTLSRKTKLGAVRIHQTWGRYEIETKWGKVWRGALKKVWTVRRVSVWPVYFVSCIAWVPPHEPELPTSLHPYRQPWWNIHFPSCVYIYSFCRHLGIRTSFDFDLDRKQYERDPKLLYELASVPSCSLGIGRRRQSVRSRQTIRVVVVRFGSNK